MEALSTRTLLEIPMRDGVILRANLLKPPSDTRYPALIFRTLYNKVPRTLLVCPNLLFTDLRTRALKTTTPFRWP